MKKMLVNETEVRGQADVSRFSLKKQKGFSTLDLGVWLIAAGALAAVGFSVASGVIGGSKSSGLVQYAAKMANDVRKLGTSGSYGSNTALNQVLIDSGRVPAAFQVSGATITHTLDGNVIVTGKNRRFVISLTGLDKQACTDIITSAAEAYERVFVDTATVAPATVTTGGYVAPILPTTANTACAQATGNTIHLVAK